MAAVEERNAFSPSRQCGFPIVPSLFVAEQGAKATETTSEYTKTKKKSEWKLKAVYRYRLLKVRSR